MTTRKDTRTDLVKELEKLPQHNSINIIINEAKAGEYHDYKNNKYVCGKVALVQNLQMSSALVPLQETASALVKISRDVMDGVYDEEADEDDIAEMKKYAPPALWPMLGLNK